jgi:site-specific recombinase XerD
MPGVWFDEGLLERIRAHLEVSKGAFAANTERARYADLKVFAEWCRVERREVLPARAQTVVAFIDAMSQSKAPATVRRYVTSITWLHRAAGVSNPCGGEEVRFATRRMHRKLGRRGSQKLGLSRDLVDRMLAASDRNTLKGLRDCALLSVAYDTLCRRSELVLANVEHLMCSDDGSGSLYLPACKTDQEGRGNFRYMAPDTMQWLMAYLKAAGHGDGPLFRAAGSGGRLSERLAGETVARIFKTMARAAGIEATAISGHSTRIGKAQDCVAAGIGIGAVMRDGGWRSEAMVARYTEHLQVKQGASAMLAAQQARPERLHRE